MISQYLQTRYDVSGTDTDTLPAVYLSAEPRLGEIRISAFRFVDYLTPDEADELARTLHDAAQAARGVPEELR